MYIAVWFDTLKKRYVCSEKSYPDPQEAIDSANDPDGDRYELCQIIKTY